MSSRTIPCALLAATCAWSHCVTAQPAASPKPDAATPAASEANHAPNADQTRPGAPPSPDSPEANSNATTGAGTVEAEASAADEAKPEEADDAPQALPPADTPVESETNERNPAQGSTPTTARSAQASSSPAPGAAEPEIFEPPLPPRYSDTPLPPVERPIYVAPRTSLWLGLRAGWLFPAGSLWQDGESVGASCCRYFNRGWDDFASSGPMLEVDLGARLSRHYNIFGMWEWGILGDGDELGDEFGGQTSAQTHFLGVGLRFSSDPNSVGLLVELALGWRRFRATWKNGTELTATDDFFNTRIGIGADIRLNEDLSLTPMLTLGGGVFSEADWTFADGTEAGAFSSFLGVPADEAAQHVPITVQIGLHWDAIASKK